MDVIFFQALAIVFLAVFIFYISDFRNKKGMLPLINKKIVSAVKYSYFIPVFIYLYTLLNLKTIFIHSYAGLIFTIGGTLLVAKAKLDLGKYHTWAGHILSSTKIVTSGIYSLIRHPIYTGIYIFMIGGVVIGIKNNPFSLLVTTVILTLIIAIMVFLGFSAKKESNFLQEIFGEIYVKYKKEVHAFLPIRKYSINKDIIVKY